MIINRSASKNDHENYYELNISIRKKLIFQQLTSKGIFYGIQTIHSAYQTEQCSNKKRD